jgi:hypothetical protein
MDAMTFLGLVTVGFFVIMVVSLIGGKTYRCNKCGFTTSSHLESLGHEKLENSHRCE